LKIHSFPPDFQQRVESWVEKFSRKFRAFAVRCQIFPLFQENSIPQTVKIKNSAAIFPQNFQEFFPFHSTISTHLHSENSTAEVLHFCTFSPKRQCGRISPEKARHIAESLKFQLFLAPYYYYYFL